MDKKLKLKQTPIENIPSFIKTKSNESNIVINEEEEDQTDKNNNLNKINVEEAVEKKRNILNKIFRNKAKNISKSKLFSNILNENNNKDVIEETEESKENKRKSLLQNIFKNNKNFTDSKFLLNIINSSENNQLIKTEAFETEKDRVIFDFIFNKYLKYNSLRRNKCKAYLHDYEIINSNKMKVISMNKIEDKEREIGKISMKALREKLYLKFKFDKEQERIVNEINNIIADKNSIDDFWLKVFENSGYFKLNSVDREVIKHLKRISFCEWENQIESKITVIKEKNKESDSQNSSINSDNKGSKKLKDKSNNNSIDKSGSKSNDNIFCFGNDSEGSNKSFKSNDSKHSKASKASKNVFDNEKNDSYADIFASKKNMNKSNNSENSKDDDFYDEIESKVDFKINIEKSLIFEFDKHTYFKNTHLKKTYFYNIHKDEYSYYSNSTNINWNGEGCDLLKINLEKFLSIESFFNFFQLTVEPSEYIYVLNEVIFNCIYYYLNLNRKIKRVNIFPLKFEYNILMKNHITK